MDGRILVTAWLVYGGMPVIIIIGGLVGWRILVVTGLVSWGIFVTAKLVDDSNESQRRYINILVNRIQQERKNSRQNAFLTVFAMP